jgi:hypothetical protein
VPIVEPEILIDGPHSAEAFAAASERAIGACVAALWRRGVALEACLLKPQMVVQVCAAWKRERGPSYGTPSRAREAQARPPAVGQQPLAARIAAGTRPPRPPR